MSLFGTGRRETVLAALLLGVCALALHLPGLFLGQHRQVLLPDDTTEQSGPTVPSDAARQTTSTDARLEAGTNESILYPAMGQAGASLRRDGTVPLWNTHARFGEPFSFSGAPIWYPPYWLLAFDLGSASFDILLALHSVIAALAMFRFLRVMPLSRYVAFVGGASYGMGWFLTANLDRLPEAAAAALLPIALECTWRCLSQRRSSCVFVLVLGLAIALMFATGSTTTAWLGMLVCAAALFAGLGAVEKEHRGLALRLAAGGIACGALLAAPLWLEWLQLAGSAQPTNAAEGHGPRLQLAGLANLVAPGLSGDLRGQGGGALAQIHAGADPLELALYPGALVVFASLLGLFRPKRTLQGLFWVAVAGAGLLLSVESPLHDWIGWAPDRPGAALVLFHLGLVVIASISLETFFDAPIARRLGTRIANGLAMVSVAVVLLCGVIAPSLGDAAVSVLVDEASPAEISATRQHVFWAMLPPTIALALIGLSFTIWRHIGILRFKPLLCIVAFLDLAIPAWTLVPHGPGIAERPAVERVLTQLPLDARDTRSLSIGRSQRFDRPSPDWIASGGQPTVDTSGTAILSRTAAYLGAIDPSCVQTTPQRSRIAPLLFPGLLEDRLVSLAGIHIATSTSPIASTDRFRPATAAPVAERTIHSGDTFLLFDSEAPKPHSRARLVYRVHHADDANAAAIALGDRTAGDRDEVLLEGRPREFSPKPPHDRVPIEWVLDKPDCVHLRTSMGNSRGYLVLADAFAPGWTATVDGEAAEILPGDLGFRAIALREGDHEVVFRYRPWSFYIGVPLAILGLLLAAGLQITSSLRTRQLRAAAAMASAKPGAAKRR